MLLCSCTHCKRQRQYDAGIDSIKAQLDTLLGSEGTQIDRLACLGMAKSRDSTDYYYFLLYRASAKMWANDYTGTESLLRKFRLYAARTQTSPKLNDLFAKYFVLKGNQATLNVKFKEAIKNYESAYSYQGKGTNKRYRTTILTDLSDNYLAMSNYAKGASCLRKVLLINDSLGNTDTKIQALTGLASIYIGLANYPEAAKYLTEVGKLAPRMHGRQLFLYYNTLGNYYFYKEDYNRTLRIFKRMNTNLNSITNTDFDKNLVWLNLADAYIRTGHIDSALVYHNKCRNFYARNQNKTALYYLETQEIAILLQKNRLKEVGLLLRKKTEPNIEGQQVCLRYNYLVDYYTRIGDDHNALIYLKRFTHINDSIKNETQKLATAESEFRYQQDSKALRLELALSKTQEHYHKIQLLFAIALFIILLLVAAYCTIYKYNKNRRIQMMKNVKKQILKLQMEELRNRVSPHFIFNVLNYELYNREHQNKETDINRLIRLIRSGLEQSDEICVPLYKELDFIDSYVELQRYGLSENFEYHLEIDKNVNENTLIPSMIIQTAVENAIKHGLRGLTGNTRLDINIRNTDHAMLVVISDNGRGLTAAEAKDDSTGTGMTVIRETLNMLNEYNEQQMVYKTGNNPGGKGCQVKIRIPLEYDYSLGG
jgi:hypothetical protein